MWVHPYILVSFTSVTLYSVDSTYKRHSESMFRLAFRFVFYFRCYLLPGLLQSLSPGLVGSSLFPNPPSRAEWESKHGSHRLLLVCLEASEAWYLTQGTVQTPQVVSSTLGGLAPVHLFDFTTPFVSHSDQAYLLSFCFSNIFFWKYFLF